MTKESRMNREQQSRSGQDFEHLAGLPVFSADNQRLGTVDEVIKPTGSTRERYMVVNSYAGTATGGMGVDQLYVPESSIQTIAQDRVILETPQGSLPTREWSTPPGGARRS
jgi:uncharacterized protein YrrD